MRVGEDRQPGRLGTTRSAGKSASAAVPPKPRSAQPAEGLTSAVDTDFREFVVSRGRSLLHSAYLLTGNLADAEDLVQSALAKTYQAWDRIEDRGALDGYVRRAMVNTHISWWRRRKLDEYPTDDLPDTPVDDATVTSAMNDALRRAIDRLPHRMRAAVVLRFFEDMTEAEVADVLGVSQGTVKSTVSRAVAKLRTDSELFTELVARSGAAPPGLTSGGAQRRSEEGRRCLRRRSLRGFQGVVPLGRYSWLVNFRRDRGTIHHKELQAAGGCPVRSTMMDVPLTVTRILQYGSTVFGDREVVTWTTGDPRRQTYAQTGVRVAKLAHALRSLGVDGDQRVATLMWNNAEHLEAYLAIPSMGAVLHTLNLRLDPEVIGYIATHAADDIVIVDPSLVPLLAQVLPHAQTIRHVLVTGADGVTGEHQAALAGPGREVHSYEALLADQPETFDWPSVDEKQAAAMCYTSGTTGHPKGVVYSHRSMHLHSMAVCTAQVFGVAEPDRVLPVVPMFHANAWGLPYAAFMAGASLIMPGRFLQPEPLVKLIEAERPTIAGAVPTIWNALLQHVRQHGGELGSLRVVPCGGSAVPHSLMEAYEKEHGVTILQAWGMTETSPLGSVARPPVGVTEEESWSYRDTQGRLICDVEARLVGEEGVPLPHDGVAVGEVEVRGPWITGAYYKDDDPEKFRDGWLRTGDVGTIDRLGFVTLTDRAKDVIKSGGEWISSMELENALMAHPQVLEAAVIGVADERWGERPLATVVLADGATVTAAELRDFLGTSVPRWQLPERWSFIAEVPKTSVGKFAKTKMRDAYARGDYEVVEAR